MYQRLISISHKSRNNPKLHLEDYTDSEIEGDKEDLNELDTSTNTQPIRSKKLQKKRSNWEICLKVEKL